MMTEILQRFALTAVRWTGSVRRTAPAVGAIDVSANTREAGAKPSHEDVTQTRRPTAGEIEQAVKALNDYLERTDRELRFSVHEATGRIIIKVYNAVTNELVRQIPPDEVLALVDVLKQEEQLRSTGLDARA